MTTSPENGKLRDTFHADNRRSWDIHDRFCVYFYRKISKNGEFTSIRCNPTGEKQTEADDLVLELQRQGVDVATRDKQTGNTIFWDEKADTHPNTGNFCLEWWSNTDYERRSPGWMQTSKAHWILYCFIVDKNNIDAYALNNQQLRRWFWDMYLKQKYPFYIMPDTINHTGSYLVPIKDVISNIKHYHCRITADGRIERLHDRLINIVAS